MDSMATLGELAMISRQNGSACELILKASAAIDAMFSSHPFVHVPSTLRSSRCCNGNGFLVLRVSLVDIGSGLWSFAHNDTGNGGWWNDLVSRRVFVRPVLFS